MLDGGVVLGGKDDALLLLGKDVVGTDSTRKGGSGSGVLLLVAVSSEQAAKVNIANAKTSAMIFFVVDFIFINLFLQLGYFDILRYFEDFAPVNRPVNEKMIAV